MTQSAFCNWLRNECRENDLDPDTAEKEWARMAWNAALQAAHKDLEDQGLYGATLPLKFKTED